MTTTVKDPYTHFRDYELMRRDGGTPVIEVTEDYFMDMLEVLPPCKWHHQPACETFHISERLTENIVEWLVRIRKDGKDRFFALAARDTCTHTAIVSKVVLAMSEVAS
jgi:hypothetical protein